jgi:hypothetical protein
VGFEAEVWKLCCWPQLWEASVTKPMNMCFIYAHFLLNQRMEMATGEKVVSFLCSFFFACCLEFFISLKDFWGFQNLHVP